MVRDEQIGDLYHQLNGLIRRSRELSNELHPGLSLVAYTFLSLVQDNPEIQASDLAERLGLDKSTVSRQLNQLFDRGLLDREGGRPGRRGDPLSLTAKGRRVLATDAIRVRTQMATWIGDWETSEIADFASSIARFNASVEHALGG
jgi:DNA-binding MarR family transcriptional regulator